MALRYIYSDAPLSTIDITDRCRVSQLEVKDNAEEGSVAISSLVVDDPDGDIEFVGHRRLYIYEDTAPVDDQVIFNGFIANERQVRGPNATGAGRQWILDLSDPNVLINRRIMNGADANRPAETDLARIQALLLMTELNTVDDDSFVNVTAATFAMDAVDYRGQNVGAYIDDGRQQSGKNGYIFYNEPLGEFGLWYDFDYSDAYDSGVRLSNYQVEIDQTTIFQYSQEDDKTYFNRDPSRIASGIYMDFDHPTDSPVYVQNAATITKFAAIDWAAPSVNVKSLAKATARANRYLLDAATEQRIIHVTMTAVPRDKVNVVKKGQLVGFASSYMTGFQGNVVCRVLNRTVREISEDPQASFEIEMDITPLPIVCPDATPSQTFAPLNPPGFPVFGAAPCIDGGNLVYTRPGISYPEVPDPTHIGGWSFPTWGSGGSEDVAGDCVENGIRIIVVGDGTLVFPVGAGTHATHIVAVLQYREPMGSIIDVEQQLGMAGDTFTFNISTEEQAHCINWVQVTEDLNFTDPCGGKAFSYDGDAVWTLTP